MHKEDLISALAEKTGTTPKVAKAFLDAFIDVVGATVADGKRVTITGFGSFERRERSPRMGTHPHTKQPIQLNPAPSVGFVPGRHLRAKVADTSATA